MIALRIVARLSDVDPPTLDAGVAEVVLSDGSIALVDVADLPLVAGYTWKPSKSGERGLVYARAWIDGSLVRMHRLILGALSRDLVDHKNGNTLDNRRENLRLTDHSGNAANRFARVSRTGFKGVYPMPSGRFRAQINVRGRALWLGSHATPERAAAAYASAAAHHFGAFANTDADRASRPAGDLTSRGSGTAAGEPDRQLTELPTRSQLTPRIASSTGAVPPATTRLAPLAGLVVAAPAAT
jgi:hypothetical protein